MVILHISNANEWSGAEVILTDLMIGDTNNRHYIVTPDGYFSNYLKTKGIIPIICKYIMRMNRDRNRNRFRKYCFHLFYLMCGNIIIMRHILRIKPDIIQCNHLSALTYVVIYSIFGKRPIILWVHDITRKLHSIDAVFMKYLTTACKKVIAISEAVRLNLLHNGVSNNKIIVIHNGVDIEYYNFKKEKREKKEKFINKYYIDPNSLIIAIIAALVPWKGHEVLLQSAQWLTKNFMIKRKIGRASCRERV